MNNLINWLKALGKKMGLLTKRDADLKLRSFKEPLYILDRYEGEKFRTIPKEGAYVKFFGGIERPIDNRGDLLHQAFLGGTEITKEAYEMDQVEVGANQEIPVTG